jgi:hypothetical protein
MNSRAPSRARLVCRIVRVWSGAGDTSPDGWGGRHVATCADCQGYFVAVRDLERDLQRAGGRPAEPAPAGLEQRLFAAIEPAVARRDVRSAWRRSVALVAAGVAVIVAAVVGVGHFETASRPDEAMAVERSVPETALPSEATALAAIARLPDNLWTAVGPRAETLTQGNPLQREIAAVQADTRSALRFLARNFLPTNATAFAEEEEAAGTSS